MAINPMLYRAAMYLKTGHPAYRPHWDAYIASLNESDQPTIATIATLSNMSTTDVARAIIRALNGLNPIPTPTPIRSPK